MYILTLLTLTLATALTTAAPVPPGLKFAYVSRHFNEINSCGASTERFEQKNFFLSETSCFGLFQPAGASFDVPHNSENFPKVLVGYAGKDCSGQVVVAAGGNLCREIEGDVQSWNWEDAVPPGAPPGLPSV